MQHFLRQIILFIFIVMISSNAQQVAAKTSPSPLPIEQAFSFSTIFYRANTVLVEWRIAPGYFLYAKKLHITLTPPSATRIQLPQGELQYDKEIGRYEAYSGNLSIPITLPTQPNLIKLEVNYQGCSQDGFCYPPVTQTRMIQLADRSMQTIINETTLSSTPSSSSSSLNTLLTDQYSVETFFKGKHIGVIIIIFSCLGLLLAFTPCVLPMIPILTSIIVGQKHKSNTKKAFLLSLTYVLGMALTYAIAGLIAASLGNSLQIWLQKPWVIVGTSCIFILLAFSLFDWYDLRLPRGWQNKISGWGRRLHGGTYIGVFLMGVLSTLIISPCVTAPLVGILMYIAQTGDRLLGAMALMAMGMGMGLPLLVIGVSAGKWLPKSGPWMDVIKKIFGLLMLVMAIWLLSRIFSHTMIVLLSALLLMGAALCLVTWRRSLRVFLGTVAIILFIVEMNAPISIGQWQHAHITVEMQSSFVIVNEMTQLKQQLNVAQIAGRPVLLDFYADWCEPCLIMDRTVFNQEKVQQVLQSQSYILLRVDLSDLNASNEAILKHLNVVAPPTILFFDATGKELYSQRIVGEVTAKEFLQRVKRIKR